MNASDRKSDQILFRAHVADLFAGFRQQWESYLRRLFGSRDSANVSRVHHHPAPVPASDKQRGHRMGGHPRRDFSGGFVDVKNHLHLSLAFVFLICRTAGAVNQCQITAPLPVPVLLSGCTYSGSLPSNSTSYIQNTLSPTTTSQAFSVANASATTTLTASYMGGNGTQCVHVDNNGLFSTTGAGDCSSGGSGITKIIAGTGLTGGGTVSPVTLNVGTTVAYLVNNQNWTAPQTFQSSTTNTSAGGENVTYNIVAGSETVNNLTSGVVQADGSHNLYADKVSLSTSTVGTLPVANGGTGTASTLTGIVRGGNPMTAAELSGDVTTSGSNAATAAAIQPNITTFSNTTGIAVVSSTFNVNNVKMIWPSSGTVGNYLRYISSNTLSWDATSGGGSGITALTGDVTATGPGSVAATLAANQPNVTSIPSTLTLGSVGHSVLISSNAIMPGTTIYQDGSMIVSGGVGASGNICSSSGKLTTSGCANGTLTGNQTITLSGDSTGSGATAITVTAAAQQNNIVTLAASSVTVVNTFQSSTTYVSSAPIVTDEYANGNTGTAQTIDWTHGGVQSSTMTGNVTYTFVNPPHSSLVTLHIWTGAGSFTAAWPSTVWWQGHTQTAPVTTTTASRTDIVECLYSDQSKNYYCIDLQGF